MRGCISSIMMLFVTVILSSCHNKNRHDDRFDSKDVSPPPLDEVTYKIRNNFPLIMDTASGEITRGSYPPNCIRMGYEIYTDRCSDMFWTDQDLDSFKNNCEHKILMTAHVFSDMIIKGKKITHIGSGYLDISLSHFMCPGRHKIKPGYKCISPVSVSMMFDLLSCNNE